MYSILSLILPTLADWTDEQVAAMISVGNARSNAFFEAEMPSGTVETPNDSYVTARLTGEPF